MALLGGEFSDIVITMTDGVPLAAVEPIAVESVPVVEAAQESASPAEVRESVAVESVPIATAEIPIEIPVGDTIAPTPISKSASMTESELPASTPSVPHSEAATAREQVRSTSTNSPISQTTDFLALTQEKRQRGNAMRLQHREEHLEKIVVHARIKPRITNDDVEKLLHVSDSTAARYFNLLVTRGLLVKEGRGRSVSYRSA